MEKILVATDLSANSIPAIQFAYNLSQIKGATLVIVHVYHVFRPKSWRTNRYENYRKERKIFILKKLHRLIDRSLNIKEELAPPYEIDLQMNPNTVSTILKCAKKHKCTYICIGTQGQGSSIIKKTIGSFASKLIAKSPIPIFSIPGTYKQKKIESICYASDLNNYQKEVRKVASLASVLQAKIRILHIFSSPQNLVKTSVIEARLFKRTGVIIKMQYSPRISSNSLIEDINSALKKIKPSIAAFFINKSTDLNSLLYTEESPSSSLFKKIPIVTFKK